jgi:hypothetical protein
MGRGGKLEREVKIKINIFVEKVLHPLKTLMPLILSPTHTIPFSADNNEKEGLGIKC